MAWQRDPGPAGVPEIRARYFDDSSFGPELVLSSADLGPTDAADGLLAAGDIAGDVAVAWVQGTASTRQIVATALLVGPGGFNGSKPFAYSTSSAALLSWSPAGESWGQVTYRVSVNGTLVAQTTDTSIVVSLPQGPASWQVTAVNGAGLTSSTRMATVFVDTLAPVATLTLSGRLIAGATLHAAVTSTDAPPPLAPADASGVASVVIGWGGGSVQTIHTRATHVYVRAGVYRVTLTVTDRAGNLTTLVRTVQIAPRATSKAKTRATPKAKTRATPKAKATAGVRATTGMPR